MRVYDELEVSKSHRLLGLLVNVRGVLKHTLDLERTPPVESIQIYLHEYQCTAPKQVTEYILLCHRIALLIEGHVLQQLRARQQSAAGSFARFGSSGEAYVCGVGDDSAGSHLCGCRFCPGKGFGTVAEELFCRIDSEIYSQE